MEDILTRIMTLEIANEIHKEHQLKLRGCLIETIETTEESRSNQRDIGAHTIKYRTFKYVVQWPFPFFDRGFKSIANSQVT